ncbi:PTS system IIB component (galactitol/fructose specific) [Streptococcus pneumoniae]|nr:PTS system IIB component (galactitol/fructose specific) [Streptococcus pneumoniae]
MNYEASKQLTDARFKRLVGVQRTTFEEILAVLKTAYQLKHAKGGRKPKLSLEDLLMAMIKILAACGAGVNSSHQIKSALEEELSNRGYDVHCDAVMVKDVNEDLMKGYDIFTPIAATDLGFEPGIPVIEAGPILFRIPAMSAPVFDNIEAAIKEHGLS